jgi:hypothetical protein
MAAAPGREMLYPAVPHKPRGALSPWTLGSYQSAQDIGTSAWSPDPSLA